jgi:hypothetical protein
MKKTWNPEKYGMVICPRCNSNGFVQIPKRQPCPSCGGFGFIKKEKDQDRPEVEAAGLFTGVHKVNS